MSLLAIEVPDRQVERRLPSPYAARPARPGPPVVEVQLVQWPVIGIELNSYPCTIFRYIYILIYVIFMYVFIYLLIYLFVDLFICLFT